MKSCVIATQRTWGIKVFDAVVGDREWLLVLSPATLRLALERHPRYAFFVNWSQSVGPDLLAMTECVNFHAFGPGPIWHRGGGPIEGLLLRGYTETLVWAHRMTNEIDAGPVYGARGPVSLAGTKEQILDRFVDPVVELIKWIVAAEPEPHPQVGEVVRFQRLPRAAYEQFWKERAIC